MLQTLIVWDYALYSDRTAGQMMRASDLVGRDQRIATLLIRIRSRFRCNPLLHADGWLGVGTGNILWSNYEARYYYFPVQFRPGLDHPNPRRFEDMAPIDRPPARGNGRQHCGKEILAHHHESIDRIVAWHRDPVLDAITERWFEAAAERGDIRVFMRRKPARLNTRGVSAPGPLLGTHRGSNQPDHGQGNQPASRLRRQTGDRRPSFQAFFFLSSKT